MPIEIGAAFRLLKAEVPDNAVRAVEIVKKGLPFKSIEILAHEAELPVEQVEKALEFSTRTLTRRKASKHLRPDESERVVRLARIVAYGSQVLGNPRAVARWLNTSNRVLGGAKPIDFLGTEIGAQAVEDVLGRIDYGIIS